MLVVKDRRVEIIRDSIQERIHLSLLCNHRILLRVLVKSLAVKYPKESDTVLQNRLYEKYGIKIKRRTVAYHRKEPLQEAVAEIPQFAILDAAPGISHPRGRRRKGISNE